MNVPLGFINQTNLRNICRLKRSLFKLKCVSIPFVLFWLPLKEVGQEMCGSYLGFLWAGTLGSQDFLIVGSWTKYATF